MDSGSEDILKIYYEYKLKLKPFCFEFITQSKEMDYLLGLGTSNESSLTKAVLKQNNVLEHFDTIVTGCSDLKGKPEPDIFLQVAKNLKVSPAECLVFEDTLVGVLAAKNAGMSVFAVADDYSLSAKDEIIRNADKYFNNFEEVLTKFKSNSLYSNFT